MLDGRFVRGARPIIYSHPLGCPGKNTSVVTHRARWEICTWRDDIEGVRPDAAASLPCGNFYVVLRGRLMYRPADAGIAPCLGVAAAAPYAKRPTHYLQSSIRMSWENHQCGDPSCSMGDLYVAPDPLFTVIHWDVLGKTPVW